MSQSQRPSTEPDVVVIKQQGSFCVDLALYPHSIVLTRKRRLHEAVWRPLFAEYGDHKAISFLEIGCQEGGATTWFLTNLLGHPDSRMTVVDIFPPYVHDTLLHNVTVGGWRDKVSVIRGKSGEALRRLPLYSFDIIYVDGLHASFAVIEDAILSWRLLKDGGILLFDDYEWAARQSLLDRPKLAIDFFLEVFEGKYELLVKKYQLAIRKTSFLDANETYLGPPAAK